MYLIFLLCFHWVLDVDSVFKKLVVFGRLTVVTIFFKTVFCPQLSSKVVLIFIVNGKIYIHIFNWLRLKTNIKMLTVEFSKQHGYKVLCP